MPTERFNRLAETKKEQIRRAIVRQLADTPFDKFSVKKLMADLGMDRRNFRFYFSDTDDMIGFALQDYWEFEERTYEELFVKGNNATFESVAKLVEKMVDYADMHGAMDAMKSIAYGVKISVNYSFEALAKDKGEIVAQMTPLLLERVREGWGKKVKDEEIFKNYIYTLVSMLLLVYRQALTSIFCRYEYREEIMRELRAELDVLRRGALSTVAELLE